MAERPTGVIIAVLADCKAAVEMGLVAEGWYESQLPRPHTPFGATWYVLMFSDQNKLMLAGEDDIIPAHVGAA